MAVGLRELVEVLGAAHAAHVAELVGREQLEHQQVRVLLLDHPAALGHERAVDLRGRLHGGHRAHDLLAEGVEQVRDAHEPAAPALALEHVEHGLAAHAQPRSEVRAHAVLGGRRAGEHRREADDRAGRVRGLDREVLRALAREPVHHGGIAPARGARGCSRPRRSRRRAGRVPCAAPRGSRGGPLRIARQPARERARGERAQGCGDRHGRGHPQQRAGARASSARSVPALSAIRSFGSCSSALPLVGSEFVSTRRQNRSPLRPRCAGAQVVVDRAPDDDREEQHSRRARPRAAQAPATAPAAAAMPGRRARAALGREARRRSATARARRRPRPASASPSGPSGASPSGAAASSTSSGYTIEKGRPSLKTFQARAAQTSTGPAARAPRVLDRARALRFHLAHAGYRIRVP